MNVHSIAWHEKCLANCKTSLAGQKAQLAYITQRLSNSIASLEADIALTERQIAEAKRRGKTSFDPDRFLIPRKKL